jgi:hypothetical protein
VISVHSIRLTKHLAAIAAAALLALGASGAQAACGHTARAAAGNERRATIPLQAIDREGPVYYWHDSSTYALLYFRPEDLVARLQTRLANQQTTDAVEASLAPALLDNIKIDLPLKESTDLFRYTLIDPRFDSVVNLVVADLLQEGKVMLDQWVFVDHPAKSIVMISRTDANGEEGGRWFCTATDDVLFKIGYAAFE